MGGGAGSAGASTGAASAGANAAAGSSTRTPDTAYGPKRRPHDFARSVNDDANAGVVLASPSTVALVPRMIEPERVPVIRTPLRGTLSPVATPTGKLSRAPSSKYLIVMVLGVAVTVSGVISSSSAW